VRTFGRFDPVLKFTIRLRKQACPILHQLQAEGLARSGTLTVALNWLTSGRFSLPSPWSTPVRIIALVGAVLDCIGLLLAGLVVEAVGIAREAKEGK